MKRAFIIDCINAISKDESQFLADSEFDELCELHDIGEDEAMQELFSTDLFIRLGYGFHLNRIND